jgi:hypothetical protein
MPFRGTRHDLRLILCRPSRLLALCSACAPCGPRRGTAPRSTSISTPLGSDRTDVEGRGFQMRKAMNGIWIAVLLHLLLLPTELHAQVKDAADETTQDQIIGDL